MRRVPLSRLRPFGEPKRLATSSPSPQAVTSIENPATPSEPPPASEVADPAPALAPEAANDNTALPSAEAI